MSAHRLYAVPGSPLRAPIPVAVLSASRMQAMGLASGMRTTVRSNGVVVGVWIRSLAEAPQPPLPAHDVDEVIWLSKRARDLLHIVSDAKVEVEVADGQAVSVTVLPAIVDDLPAANEVHMAAAAVRRFGPWALVYGAGRISMPVRVRRRRVPAGSVRMSMLTRTLADVPSTDDPHLEIAKLQPESLRWLDRLRGRTSFGGFLGFVVAVLSCFPADTQAATVDTWGSEAAASAVMQHLVVGLAAEMRGELRIPRRTVVTVRRRVLSLFAQRINELTVPVGGLLLAALTIQGLSRTFVAVGIVIVTILAMLPARYRIPPRGRWP